MRDIQTDFRFGEFSPRTNGRVDMEWYKAGAREMSDFIALPQGPAEARPGTIHIDDFDDPTLTHRVKAMYIDHDNTILLVMNTSYVYAYELLKDGSTISAVPILTDASEKARVAVRYNPPDLYDIQMVPYEGRMYLVHPNYEMKEITFSVSKRSLSIKGFVARYRKWVTGVNYKLNDVVYWAGKLLRGLIDDPDGSNTTPPVVSKTGYFLRIASRTNILEVSTAAIGSWADTMTTYGNLCVHESRLWVLGTKGDEDKDGNYEAWYYPEAIPQTAHKNDDGSVYYTDDFSKCDSRLIKVSRQNRKADHPTDPSGKAWLHVLDLPVDTTNLNPYVGADNYTVGDIFYYDGYVYTCVVETPTAGIPPTDEYVSNWMVVSDAPTFESEGYFPNLVTFHDKRMYILGTLRNPGMIYASKTGQIDDFTIGTNDDSGIQIQLGTDVSELSTWAKSRRDLLIGSAKSEWIITGGDGPITPTSMFAFPQSRSGSMRDGAIDISDMMVFFQKGGQRLLRFVFSNDQQSYATPDMNQLSEHIFGPRVVEFALQSNPDFILWCVMEDGTVVGGTYDPSTQMFGWHRHITDGFFESVEITANNFGEDEVWFTVKRLNAAGETVRNLERFAFRKQDIREEMIYSDDAEIITVSNGVGYVSPDKYGMTLTVLYGGAAHPDVVAGSTDGKVTFQHDLFTQAVVGRAYYPKLRPQKLYPSGSRLDVGVRISRAAIRVHKTLGVKVGANEDTLEPLIFRTTTGIMGQPPPLYSGEVPHSINHSFGDEDWLLIMRDQPFPCMILGVTYELEAGGI